MTPEQWQEIKTVLGAVLEIEPGARPAYLDRNCGDDLLLRREVERLLHHSSLDAEFLDSNSLSAVASSVLTEQEGAWTGRRIGSYQIIEPLGVGGMGEVYRAFRADDQYRKEVALKIVRAGQDSGFVLSRFKSERQILANLEHPNIARLLDGGTTEEGIPYFVMELIEGMPITEYCDAKKLGIADRLELFSQVCAAVQYAHQGLIIHRDIKPANILVTADGTPKLLDFGIAKILASESSAGSTETLATFRILTPRYASPEQIKGEPMTTASDVYSLGVVLYELLTGQSPYGSARGTSGEFAEAACQNEPPKPSFVVCRSARSDGESGGPAVLSELRGGSPERLRKQLRGDLDNVVLMALRKEPSRRYASVSQLKDDLRRHLESLPVLACGDTFAYRTSKFVRRHKAVIGASFAVALALVVGLAMALHEARIARVQRARAERRFNDVRKLANSLMFDIHDAIANLPGAMPARKLLVDKALEYLDSLSQESGGDIALQRELASAYDRVGDLLGYTGGANLGDFAGARQSYEKALAIRESAAAANPQNEELAEDLLSDYFRLSFVLQDEGDCPGALQALGKGLPLAQKLAAAHPDARYQDWLAGFYWRTGNVLRQQGDYAHALEMFRRGAEIREAIAKSPDAPPLLRSHLAADYIGLGLTLGHTGDLSHGLEKVNDATQILEPLSAADPNNATLREYLAETYAHAAFLLERQGNIKRAIEYRYKARQIHLGLISADPTNALARDNYALGEIAIGDDLVLTNSMKQALPHLQKGMSVFETVRNKNRYSIAGQAEAYCAMGTTYAALGEREKSAGRKIENLRQAAAWYRKSLGAWEHEPDQGATNPLDGDYTRPDVERKLALCEDTLKQLARGRNPHF